MTLQTFMLHWQEGKTASFRLFFLEADAKMWARANQAKIGTNWKVMPGEIHGDLPLFVCYRTNEDEYSHIIFTDKKAAETWLQANDSGRMDVRQHKVAELF